MENELRERVRQLTDELDTLDHQLDQVSTLFRDSVSVLSGLCPDTLSTGVLSKLGALRKSSTAKPIKVESAHTALQGVKDAILADHSSPGLPAAAQSVPQVKEEDASSLAARHVSLALLQCLRLGDPAFDGRLDKAIDEIDKLVSEGEVRPAMGILVDLLDGFRGSLEARRAEAEAALREVVAEVLRYNSELAESFSRSHDQALKDSSDHHDHLTRSVASLLEDINNTADLPSLKKKALSHIRSLRDQIKDRRAKESKYNKQMQQEAELARKALAEAKSRMAQVQKVSQQLSREALTDPLTKAWNKRAFSYDLADTLQSGQNDVHLVVFDIDHFKNVNDNFGHRAGDKALEAITKQAQASLRQGDSLYRYAGDEFVLILHGASAADALNVAERVRQACERIRFTYGGKGEIRLTVSMGISQARPGDTPDGLFERADMALLEAKRQGRNRIVSAN